MVLLFISKNVNTADIVVYRTEVKLSGVYKYGKISRGRSKAP